MLDVTVRRPVAPTDIDWVRRIADRAEAADGRPSLGDSVWRDLTQPTPTSAIVVATIASDPVGALHIAPPENERDNGLTMALVVDPRHREAGIERALLDAALADSEVHGHPTLLWVFGADDRADAFAAAAGFTPARELRQLRVSLPLQATTSWPAGIAVRPFRVGDDEAAWLAVNNRSFADDPDQRGWTLQTLRRREAEPWFDPEGFLLAWSDGALAGFCWTRLHPASRPREAETLGEIYVIGVDPNHQGIGLGRALVVGGLESLHARGASAGMLFVDAANRAAVGLYEALGFTTRRVDRAYARNAS